MAQRVRFAKGGGCVPRGQAEYFARCASGFEPVLADELRGLGISRIRMQNGSVAFFATLRNAYRVCLWSRVATRIQLVLARISAFDADELYEGAAAFRWEDHVCEGATIAVHARGTNANLINTQFTALKVKDAICDRLRDVRGSRPDVDPRHPDFSVNVALHERKATLCLDLSGEALHRRGYRQSGVQTEAPLKETLAAGTLLAAGWDELSSGNGVLVDPMCGSGTFAIEGALIAAGIAPGLLRERWGFSGWMRHDTQIWEELIDEAQCQREQAFTSARIIAGDVDEAAVQIARANAERAGVAQFVRYHVDDARNLARHMRGTRNAACLMVANPPYGMRLLSEAELPQVHDALGAAAGALPHNGTVALITPDLGVDTALGRLPERIIPCRNGAIEAWVRIYDMKASAPLTYEAVSVSGVQRSVRIADPSSAQFANRLRKVAKERARWAQREGVSAYRVYDADLPDFPVSVDLFYGAGADEGELFALVEERPRPNSVDVQRAGRHFADVVALAAAILDIPVRNVVQKPWATDDRYERTRDSQVSPPAVCVSEGGYLFDVSLSGTAGKGLPLELRKIRAFVASRAKGLRFACLFSHGSTAAVFAAGAGAKSTTMVDSSKERVEWARQALRANGFAEGSADVGGRRSAVGRRVTTGKRKVSGRDGAQAAHGTKAAHGAQAAHGAICMDVRAWLAREAKAHHLYDLVLCTPPTHLAARGGEKPWELSRDLPELLRLLDQILPPAGAVLLVFPPGKSTASLLSPETSMLLHGYEIEDLSEQMVPEDFSRSHDHQSCYLLTKIYAVTQADVDKGQP